MSRPSRRSFALVVICADLARPLAVLSVAYKDRQKMNCKLGQLSSRGHFCSADRLSMLIFAGHDDGEHGLGPVVSSLSLGSDGTSRSSFLGPTSTSLI